MTKLKRIDPTGVAQYFAIAYGLMGLFWCLAVIVAQVELLPVTLGFWLGPFSFGLRFTSHYTSGSVSSALWFLVEVVGECSASGGFTGACLAWFFNWLGNEVFTIKVETEGTEKLPEAAI